MSKPSRLEGLRRALAQLRDEEYPPEYLMTAAIALHGTAPISERLPLLAAATKDDNRGFKFASQTGHWNVGYYPGISAQDRAEMRGMALLQINEEFREAYEGLVARIFVTAPDGERTLVEGRVTDGALYAEVCIADLDLERRDAINVLFLPRTPKP